MKIIVLAITPYKEKDAIIEAISEEGMITFLARGILDPKSKNTALNNVLTIADIELHEGNFKYPILKVSSQVESPLLTNSGFEFLTSLQLISEATNVLLQDEEKAKIFSFLNDTIKALKATKNHLMVILIYLARLLKESGYEFEINRCVFCGQKKDIVAFSFRDGGFVCKDCLDETTERDLNKNQMLFIRFIFSVVNYDIEYEGYNDEDAYVLLNKMKTFIYDSYGINLKSFAFFK